MSHHAGLLEISGTAPDNLTTRWLRIDHDTRPNMPTDHAECRNATDRTTPPSASVDDKRLDHAILITQAKDALVGLGWKPQIARAAVEEARAHVGVDARVEDLVREALRHCPKPSTRMS